MFLFVQAGFTGSKNGTICSYFLKYSQICIYLQQRQNMRKVGALCPNNHYLLFFKELNYTKIPPLFCLNNAA